MSTDNPRLAWALHLADRGWPVFPVLPLAKRPAIRQWEQRATTDPDRITAFWTTHPRHNIGLPAGRAGLLVVDLDTPGPDHTATDDERTRGAQTGAQVFASLAHQAHAQVPDTWTVFTPSGGIHLYFAQPAGQALRNTAGILGPLVDTRGHGGYVLAPGSTTPQGGYELTVDTDPAAPPGWLVHRLTVRPSTATTAPRRIAATNRTAWLAAALAGEEKRILTAASGAHNKAQAIAAYNLGRLVGGGHLTREHARRVLSSAVASHVTGPCHCTDTGVQRVIAWGLDNGARNPRHLHTERGAA